MGGKDVGDLWLPGERRFVVEAKHHARWTWPAGPPRPSRGPQQGRPVLGDRPQARRQGEGEDQWATTDVGHFLALVNRPVPLTTEGDLPE
jgi:hypothetical protein